VFVKRQAADETSVSADDQHPGEVRIPASRTADGVLMERGDLVVTNDALVFRPRRGGPAAEAELAWQRRPSTLVGRNTILAAVHRGASGRLNCPPTLVVEDASGRTVEFAILGHSWSPNWSARNKAARDRAISVLASVLN
jgi:hypothetical protein